MTRYTVASGEMLNSIENLIATVKDEGAIQKEKYEYGLCFEALDFLDNNNVKDVKTIKSIMEKTFIIRDKNNEKLKKLYKIVNTIKESGEVFDDDAFNKIYPLYIEIHKLNFESIKNISQGIKFYDDIQKAANKKRRSMSVRFNRKLYEPLYKLDYQLSYYRRLLKTYDSVINMSMSQYCKLIEK